MSKPTFDINIAPDGTITLKVHGVSGGKCIELSDMVRDIVGKEDSRKLTSEYYGGDGHVRIDAHVQDRTKG